MRLTLSTKLAYWFGQLAEGLMNSGLGLLLLFYYNQVLDLPGSLCGLALLIATVSDAVTDPMMGTISDNWRSRFGRRHPFMYASALPVALFFYLLFNPLVTLVTTEFSLFLWLTGFAILARMAMTLYHVPHMALAAEMTTDFDERTSIVAYRMAFGQVGWLVTAGLGFGVFFVATDEYPNGQLNAAAYPPLILILAVGMFVSIAVTSLGTQHLVPYLPRSRSTPDRYSLSRILSDLKKALTNRSFFWLVMSQITASVAVGVSGALGLYVNTFYWELSPSQIPFLVGCSMIALTLGYLVSPQFGPRMEKRTLYVVGFGIWSIMTVVPYALRFVGLFPEIASMPALVVLIACTMASTFCGAQLVVASNSMMADVADEHDLDSGTRSEGVFFGAVAFSNKAANGIGAAIAGISLDLIAWPTGPGIKTAADVDPATLTSLAIVAGPIIALSFIPCYVCIRRYTIDRARYGEIKQVLSRRSGL